MGKTPSAPSAEKLELERIRLGLGGGGQEDSDPLRAADLHMYRKALQNIFKVGTAGSVPREFLHVGCRAAGTASMLESLPP